MADYLFIDIETTQCQDESLIQNIRENIKPPGTIKKPESIKKWMDEKSQDAVNVEVSKTSFSGLAGTICSIAWAINDGEIKSLSRGVDDSEQTLLESFFTEIAEKHFSPVWVAHNIDFDFRFLFHRCVINDVFPLVPIPYNAKPWSFQVYCTLYETMGNSKAGGSLSRIAKAFGIEGKLKGVDGSMVNQYWLDGRIGEIADYNKQDVEITRNIFKKLNFIDAVAGFEV